MIRNLEQLYHEQIRDLYSAETQLIAALPTMVDNATNEDLRMALSDHLAETRDQLDRLIEICDSHGIECEGEECEAMKGLIREATKHLQNTEPGEVRDAVIIASANRVEHYEIAAYGVAKTFAEVLGFDDAAALLDESLEEEATADDTITQIATGGIFTTGVNEAANY